MFIHYKRLQGKHNGKENLRGSTWSIGTLKFIVERLVLGIEKGVRVTRLHATAKIVGSSHKQLLSYQAFNVMQSQHPTEEDRFSDKLFLPDCDLTETGIEQSRQAGMDLIQLLAKDTDLEGDHKCQIHFVVSPLRRALQTTQNMLQSIQEDKDESKDRSTASLALPAIVVVQPLAAEIMMDACDIGTPVEELQTEFPEFDMKLVRDAALPSSEGYWWAYHRSVDETWDRMKNRLPEGSESSDTIRRRITLLKSYLKEVCNHDEQQNGNAVVVLVAHSETIWWLGKPTPNWDAAGDVTELDGLWTRNGEVVDLTNFYDSW